MIYGADVNEIARLRRQAGMTLKQFGELLGYSESGICRWERNNRTLPKPIVMRSIRTLIAEHLKEKRK